MERPIMRMELSFRGKVSGFLEFVLTDSGEGHPGYGEKPLKHSAVKLQFYHSDKEPLGEWSCPGSYDCHFPLFDSFKIIAGGSHVY